MEALVAETGADELISCPTSTITPRACAHSSDRVLLAAHVRFIEAVAGARQLNERVAIGLIRAVRMNALVLAGSKLAHS